MALVVDCVTFDCADPKELSRFWTEALGYELRTDESGWLELGPREGNGPLLGFQKVPEEKTIKNRVHLDLAARAATMDTEVKRLEGLGARRGEAFDDHIVVYDPEGNEFCVVQP